MMLKDGLLKSLFLIKLFVILLVGFGFKKVILFFSLIIWFFNFKKLFVK